MIIEVNLVVVVLLSQIFLKNQLTPPFMFTRIKDRRQRAAVKRRYVSVEVTGPLQSIGRPFTPSEKRARRVRQVQMVRSGPKKRARQINF